MSRALLPALSALAWLALASPLAARADPPAVRASVPIAGGVAGLAEVLGAPRPFDRATALLDAARLLHESPPGQSAAADRRRRQLAAYGRSRADTRGTLANGGHPAANTVPLPLPPRVWSAVVFGRPVSEDELALAILADRRAALLYAGLYALDDETLEYLSRDRKTLAALADRHAAAFAAFGRSLQVRDGRVVTPGGDADRPLWEALVGAPVDPPGPFILALFGAAGGRLAYFYDTMAHLDEPRRRYALASSLDSERRLEAVQALVRIFVTAHPGWVVADRPFARPALDAALVLRLLHVDPDGRPTGPVWPTLLSPVFDDLPAVVPGASRGTFLPADPARATVRVEPDERADAAWLLERLLSPLPPVGQARLEALLFGQRVFPDPSPTDAPDLLLAMRGRIVFPTLVATLERLGVRDARVYAKAVARAASPMRIASPAVQAVALAQFQGALAFLDRLARQRVLSTEEAATLLDALVALDVDPEAGYAGQVAQWLERLAAALGRLAGPDVVSPVAPVDDLLVRGLAGALSSPRRPPTSVEWDGERYRVDYGAPELARIRAVRRNQGGHDLDAVLAFARAAARLARSSPGDAPAVVELLAPIEAALADLDPPRLVARHAGRAAPDLVVLARRALDAIRAGGAGTRAAAVRTLVFHADALLADVVTALAYALFLGAPDGPALLAGSVALRHDFGVLAGRRTPWDPAPGWAFPTEDRAGGWHLVGSLLGLDLALARLSLRYPRADVVPDPPLVTANDWRTLAETVVLMDPATLPDDEGVRLSEAIARGRERADLLVARPDLASEVARDAGLGALERAALAWRLAHDRAAVASSFSLGHLLRLGGGRLPAAWGTSARSATGCWCLDAPPPEGWETFAGRPMTGLLATRVVDLTLRTALELRVRALPAALVPAVLALATPDFLHAVRPVHADDLAAFTRGARELSSDSFTAYLSALASGGPLVEVSDAGTGRARERRDPAP